MNTTGRRLELAVMACLLLLAVFAFWQAALMPSGTLSLPGPGMLPMALGALLALSVLALFALRLGVGPQSDVPLRLGSRQIGVCVLALLAAGLLFERAGFVVTGALFLWVLLWMLSPLGWWRSSIAGVAAALVTDYLFKDLLGVSLPSFPWTS